MTVIAWRFNFTREAAKALARAATHAGTGGGGGSLRQQLLEGRHCEQLEAGMLLDPAGHDEEEEQQQLPGAWTRADARQSVVGTGPGAQRGRQRAATEGEEQASPKEERRLRR